MAGRIYRSAEERERIVSDWKSSGLSARAFSKQQGLTKNLIYRWLAAARRRTAPPRILRVIRESAIATPTSSTLTVEVSGARIAVPTGFDRATFAAVLQVLDRQCQELRS